MRRTRVACPFSGALYRWPTPALKPVAKNVVYGRVPLSFVITRVLPGKRCLAAQGKKKNPCADWLHKSSYFIATQPSWFQFRCGPPKALHDNNLPHDEIFHGQHSSCEVALTLTCRIIHPSIIILFAPACVCVCVCYCYCYLFATVGKKVSPKTDYVTWRRFRIIDNR